MKTTWPIVVVYEDDRVKQKAVEFCDELLKRFWAEGGVDIDWLEVERLEHPKTARVAGKKAAEAEYVIVALRAEGGIPEGIKAWIESWLHLRGDREGALVGLVGSHAGGREKHLYLRNAAMRGGFDYLTEVPQAIAQPIPDSLEYCTLRAQQVTGVLTDILRRRIEPRTQL